MGQVLINEQLIFDEDRFLLFSVSASNEEPLRLGAIASRCFALMLRSEEVVVRKRELMAGVWGRYGLEVTDNSLAQVIRQLRLALEKLQPGRDFIQTVPRIGYRLTDGVKVEELLIEPANTSVAHTEEVGNDSLAQREQRVVFAGEGGRQSSSTLESHAPRAELDYRLPRALSVSPHGRRWLALLVWGVLAFLLGVIGLAPATNSARLEFEAPTTMGGIQVYRSASDLSSQTASYLQSLIIRSQRLAELMGISFNKVHLYLLPARRGVDQILCDGELQSPLSRCIGVQQRG